MLTKTKAALAHHPIIQREMNELYTKGAIEPSTGAPGFYSSMYFVPNYIAGL